MSLIFFAIFATFVLTHAPKYAILKSTKQMNEKMEETKMTKTEKIQKIIAATTEVLKNESLTAEEKATAMASQNAAIAAVLAEA